MELHLIASRVLGVMPRNPEQFHATFDHAMSVLAAEPAMRWSCIALIAAGVGLALTRRLIPTLIGVLALGVTSYVWLQVSHVREGVILYTFSYEHGLTEADLLVPVVVTISVVLWLIGQAVWRRRGPRETYRQTRTVSITSS
ncbi:hypothetical protein GCM10022223_40100 [Kineosporia mesophila]|uniref:Uncharacterized protein n=1 Tax=Kineosporia mesophila TaxID=566012 RepID=A0ABP6ZWC4_9ACTN|nr:hypothetical protein [Kineosporia mesophila]MCD5348629.1 hypothetical protein [Kineosporia mesophila]